MYEINPAIAGLLDVLASELQTHLSLGPVGDVTVSRADDRRGQTPSDLIWWSWSLSIDPSSRILAGAPLETWREIGGLGEDTASGDATDECLARLASAIEQAARSRFGSEVTCAQANRSDAPPPDWTSVPFAIGRESGSDLSIYFSVSRDLESALGVPLDDSEISPERELAPSAGSVSNSAEILMHVEMPVSVSLGRTKMRMRDLLHLTNGSVVELDQELGDEVEIRVNTCVIAYGEVVAVDGNYAVRVLRMASSRNAQDLRGALPGRAA